MPAAAVPVRRVRGGLMVVLTPLLRAKPVPLPVTLYVSAMMTCPWLVAPEARQSMARLEMALALARLRFIAAYAGLGCLILTGSSGKAVLFHQGQQLDVHGRLPHRLE